MSVFERMSVSEFSNERPGNLVHWRIVANDWRRDNDDDADAPLPHYFVYRVVEDRAGRPVSEYLTVTGEVDCNCAKGWFRDYADIGSALIKNHAREQAAGHSGFYTFEYAGRANAGTKTRED
jgi:hypothetical protein